MIGFKVEGLEELAKNCDMVVKEINRMNLNATLNITADLIGKSKKGAPHKTGELRRSIKIQSVEAGSGVVAVVYGSELPYARIQELGGRAGRNLSVFITGRHYLRNPLRSADKIAEKYYRAGWDKIESKFKI